MIDNKVVTLIKWKNDKNERLFMIRCDAWKEVKEEAIYKQNKTMRCPIMTHIDIVTIFTILEDVMRIFVCTLSICLQRLYIISMTHERTHDASFFP